VLAKATDVRDPAAVEALAQTAIGTFGQVDILCNNAGVVGPVASVWEQDEAVWRWVIDVVLMGVVHGIRSCVPHSSVESLVTAMNTASMAGLIPAPKLAPYGAAKHAVVVRDTSYRAARRCFQRRCHRACPELVETKLGGTSFRNRLARVEMPAVDSELPVARFGSRYS
jgi:NADP-dependent 3-hydroxy acid dehydrogenase YdfG